MITSSTPSVSPTPSSSLASLLSTLRAPSCTSLDLDWMYSYPAARPFFQSIETTFQNIDNSNWRSYVLDDGEIKRFEVLEKEGHVLKGEELERTVGMLMIEANEGDEEGDDGSDRRVEILREKIARWKRRVEGMEGLRGILLEEIEEDRGDFNEDDENAEYTEEEAGSLLGQLEDCISNFGDAGMGTVDEICTMLMIGQEEVGSYCEEEEKIGKALMELTGRDKKEWLMDNEGNDVDDRMGCYEEWEEEARRLVALAGTVERQRVAAQIRVSRASAILDRLRDSSIPITSSSINMGENEMKERKTAVLKCQGSWQQLLKDKVLPLAHSVGVALVQADMLLEDREGALRRLRYRAKLLHERMKHMARARARLLLLFELAHQRRALTEKAAGVLDNIEEGARYPERSRSGNVLSAAADEDKHVGTMATELAAIVAENFNQGDEKGRLEIRDGADTDDRTDNLGTRLPTKSSVDIILEMVDANEISRQKFTERSRTQVWDAAKQEIKSLREQLTRGDDWFAIGVPVELTDSLCRLKELLGQVSASLNRLLKDRVHKLNQLKAMGSQEDVDTWRKLWVFFMTNPKMLRKIVGK